MTVLVFRLTNGSLGWKRQNQRKRMTTMNKETEKKERKLIQKQKQKRKKLIRKQKQK